MSMLHLSRWNKNTSEFNWSNSLKPTYWNLWRCLWKWNVGV